jgi:hypothetical protein
MTGQSGFVASVHTAADVAFTLDGFAATLRELKEAGVLEG